MTEPITTITLKIQQEGSDDIRRISVNKLGSFSSLRELLEKLFQKNEFKIKYKDEEGDSISIDSDLEWTEAINYAERNKNTLRLTINDGKSGNSSTPTPKPAAQNTTQIPTSQTPPPSNTNPNADIDTLIQNFGPMIAGFGIDPNSPQVRSMIQSYLQRAGQNPAQLGAMIQQFLPMLQGMNRTGGAPYTPWNPAGFGTNSTGSNNSANSNTSQTKPQTPKMTEEEMIAKLVEMGYDPELSKETLTACNGNFNEAVQRLVNIYN